MSAHTVAIATILACLGGFATCDHTAVAFEGDRPKPASAKSAGGKGSANVDGWLVGARGVGALQLGAAPPAPPAGFEAAYTTRFYSDAQPLEGFAFDDPPATAYVEGGPFFDWGYKNRGEEPPAKLRQQAAQLARAKKLSIGMIVVTDPRPKTDKQIGVGDGYGAFARAYPGAGPIKQYPGVWEEPSCLIQQNTVWYFFDRCKDPDRAKLVRIVVQQPRTRRHADEE